MGTSNLSTFNKMKTLNVLGDEHMKPKVFVISPFSNDFTALYEELKEQFKEQYAFYRADDLDTQQNILKDIVMGINNADIIIADLTGLNPNVFYELGLAHAMNKKVIIITQSIEDLPFDIKSYKVNEYSLQFNKLPKLIETLSSLLMGAIANTTAFGSPITDYLLSATNCATTLSENNEPIENLEYNSIEEKDEILEKGFLDYLADVNENSASLVLELNSFTSDLMEIRTSTDKATAEITRVQNQSGKADTTFVRNVCRKLATPLEQISISVNRHIENISAYWSLIENDYLSLLDSKFILINDNANEIKNIIPQLQELQNAVITSNESINTVILEMNNILGIERRLTKAAHSLIVDFEAYLSITDTMNSSIDRMISKSLLAIEKFAF